MKDPSAPRLHSRRRAISGVGLAMAGSFIGSASVHAAPAASNAPRPAGPLRSAGVMALGPGNVLFVADIAGAAVHAFRLTDEDLVPQTDVALGNFHNFEGVDLVRSLDVKLAGLMGTTYDNIVINDMVVHQPTKQILLSVERGRGPDIVPAIVKVDRGRLELLKLDGLPHTKVSIPNEPDKNARLEFEPQRVYAITDVKYYDGEVFVTGISNQRFASTLYRIPYPFTGQKATCTVEIWHPVHGEFETRAPIIRQLIREISGEPHLFAVYGCTPLVRFPLAVLKDGAHVRGETIGELGYGSNPLDMLTFNNPFDHKDYLLVTIDVRSASQIAVADLETAPPEPTGGPIDFGPGGVGRTQRYLPVRAEHTAILDPRWAVVIWRHPKTTYGLVLGTLMVPYFFDRRFGMSEMNFPGGPDPFHYKAHRDAVDHI
jgi:hypothetical protein